MNLVIGATGNIGRPLVSLLTARGAPIRVVSRDEARGAALRSARVDVLIGDLLEPSVVERALAGVQRVFLATPSGPDQEPIEVAVFEAARSAGVEHLVKVSVIDPSPDHVVELARVHHRLEAALVASGVPHTILRPNWFMDNFFGSAPTIAKGAIYGSAGAGRLAFVDARDIAAVADCVLASPRASDRELVVTGPEALTFAEAAVAIGRGLGGKPVSYFDLDEPSFAGALASAGLPKPVIEVVLQINRNAKRDGLSRVTDVVPRLTGRPARSLEDFTHDHAARFA